MTDKAGLRDKDLRYVWHPFTQMAEYEPCVIAEAEGAVLRDDEGREYIDAVSSLWVNVHGHRRPEIDEAIRRQLGRAAHTTALGLSNPPAIELAERLVDIAPGELAHVFFSDSGAAAVEVALKIAFQYWRQKLSGREPQRTRFLSLDNGYHGDTLGAVSVGGIPLFHEMYGPLTVDHLRAPSPYCYRCELTDSRPPACGMACLAAMDDILTQHGSVVAGVVVESAVQAAGGIITMPEGYMAGVADLCRRHGTLLVVDEVAVGFGRTGRMFGCEIEGVRPDLMALGKGISGGYLPVSATLATDRIYEAFLGEYSERKTFFHGHSYSGNPLGCAAGLASLDVFEHDRVLESLPPKIERMSGHLHKLARMSHVGDVRQCGMIGGIELVADKRSREAFAPDLRIGARVCEHARRFGVMMRPLGDVLVWMPPLCVTEKQIDTIAEATRESISAITEQTRCRVSS